MCLRAGSFAPNTSKQYSHKYPFLDHSHWNSSVSVYGWIRFITAYEYAFRSLFAFGSIFSLSLPLFHNIHSHATKICVETQHLDKLNSFLNISSIDHRFSISIKSQHVLIFRKVNYFVTGFLLKSQTQAHQSTSNYFEPEIFNLQIYNI